LRIETEDGEVEMNTKGRPMAILWRRKVLVVALGCAFAAAQVQANGVGPVVVAGQAGFAASGSVLAITNTPGAIINWQGFSIGAGETTRFIQQSAASSVLNRVIGSDPSVILGTLSSNGRVFLINPAGILVGAGARIDVAGLVASTLNLSNQDFLAGRLNFTANPLAGKVDNQGSITTPSGGSVYLVGSTIDNSGVINSPRGEVMLAAGQSVKILDSGTPGVRVELTASDNAVVNLGRILSQSGQVGIYGAALRNAGVIDADQVVKDASGRIVLRAKQDVALDAGSRLSASGDQAGEITVRSEGGTTLVSGSIDAHSSGEAVGVGGSVQLLGERVGLIAASIDVSGGLGGGSVLVGGDFQGRNPAVQNAVATYVSADSRIVADARTLGAGGKVVLWANDSTRAYGSISARGGVQGGDGGMIETSGHWLDVAGIGINAGAANGKGGVWLLDPADVTITGAVDSGGSFTGGDPDVFVPDSAAATSNVNLTNITTTLNLGTDVTITTANTGVDGGGNGDISVDAVVTWSVIAPTTPSTLTLSAVRDVNVNSAITATRGSFVANAGRDVNLKAVITTTDGDVVLRADSDGTGPGVAGGTVAFLAGGSVTMTRGAASIYYNPTSYATPTNYLGNFTLTDATLNAYMLVFVQGNDKVYDGLTTTSLSFVGDPTLGGVVTLVPGVADFGTSDVGIGKAIAYSGYSLGGGDAGNFSLFSSAGNATADVSKRPVTVTADAGQGKTYGNLDPTPYTYANTSLGAGIALAGLLDRAAGETVGGYAIGQGSLTDANNGNYTLTYVGDNFAISQRPITLAAVVDSKTYGNADPALAVAITGGSLGSATVADTLFDVSGTLSRQAGETVAGGPYDINLGSGATVGTRAGNYAISFVADNDALSITPRPVTVTADAGQGKTYGNLDPTPYTYANTSLGAGIALAGLLDRAAGETVGGYAIGQGSLTDANNGNYTLTYVGDNFAISQRPITLAAVVDSKTYGNADPALAVAITGGSLGSATVADTLFDVSGTLSRQAGETVAGGPYDINLGSGATVGTRAGNYAISFVADNDALSITPRPVTVTADAGQGKTYGNLDPTPYTYANTSLGAGIALAGLLDRAAGETVGGYAIGQGSLTDANNGNYTLTYVGDNFAISQRPITLAAVVDSKTYGNADPALAVAITGGSLGSATVADTLFDVSGTLSRQAGETVAGGPYDINLGSGATVGTRAGNYAISFVADNDALSITPRPVTVTADAGQGKTYGNLDPTPYTYANTSLGAGIALAGLLDRAAGETVGGYAIGQGSLTDANNGNYTLTYVGDNFAISQRPITLAAVVDSKTYGNADPALAVAITGGSLGSATVADTLFDVSGTLSRQAGETVAGGPYDINLGSGATVGTRAGNYAISFVADNDALSITPRPVTVTADAGQGKTYGNLDPTPYTYANTSLGAGIALAGLLDRAAGETVGGYAIGQGSLTDANNGNYTLTYVGDNFAISQRPITLAAVVDSKTYGNADPALAVAITGGSLGSATVADTLFDVSGTLSRQAGETVAGGPYDINLGSGATVGTRAGNYAISFVADNDALSITPRPVTVTADAGQGKTYGNLDPTPYTYANTSLGAGIALAGLLDRAAGETVGGYAIGQGSLTDANNGNYTLTYVGDNFAISQRPITLAAVVDSKTYGNADPALAVAITGGSLGSATVADTLFDVSGTLSRQAGETVAGGPYDINLGSGATVGTRAGNYAISFVADNDALSITPRPVTVTADAGQGKTYGNLDPTPYTYANTSLGAGIALAGLLDRAAGETVGGYAIGQGSLTDANNGNYTLTYVGDNFAISQRPITLAAVVDSKTYGNADPALAVAITGGSLGSATVADTLFDVSGTLSRQAGETVAGGPYDINLGSGATVGTRAGNYAISFVADNDALSITPRPVTVTADAGQGKTYGNLDPTPYTYANTSLGAGIALAGLLDRAAGETVGGYAIGQGSLTDANNGNYTLTYVGDNFAVMQATLNVVANLQTKLFGTSDPILGFGVFGLVNNPALGIADSAATVLSGSLARAPGESVAGSPYAINQGSLAVSGNYVLAYTGNFLVIADPATAPVPIFVGVVNNQTYYRPGNFWHVSLNSVNADRGFDVLRGTSDTDSRLRRNRNSCDSVFAGGFCETWSFPQQRAKVQRP
jgi:filamentous hemagglutinin family protein